MWKSVAVLTLATVPALAQHPDPFGVWDAQGKFVGTLVQQGFFEFHGALLQFHRDSIADGGLFGFTAANCSGTPYIGADYLPANATVHNGQAFVPQGPAAQISAASILYVVSGSCVNLADPQPAWWATPTPIPITGFVQPFCVSATRVECR